MMNKNGFEVRGFYGAIIGDIVGSVYEFNNIKTKDFPIYPPKAHFTDDTVMTLAIACTLSDASEFGVMGNDDVCRFDLYSNKDWLHFFADDMRRVGRHYPRCGYGSRFWDWVFDDRMPAYNSCGNGSAMRVSAVGQFARTLEECERLARLTAEVSHNHPDGIAGAQATAGAVFLALHGATKEEIRAYVEKHYKIAFTLDEIRPTYTFDHFAGICKGTVPYAVECFLESTDFEDCLRNTVSIGGDTDTLAAVSCAIAEAYYGTPWDLAEKARGYLDKRLLGLLDYGEMSLRIWQANNSKYFAKATK